MTGEQAEKLAKLHSETAAKQERFGPAPGVTPDETEAMSAEERWKSSMRGLPDLVDAEALYQRRMEKTWYPVQRPFYPGLGYAWDDEASEAGWLWS